MSGNPKTLPNSLMVLSYKALGKGDMLLTSSGVIPMAAVE